MAERCLVTGASGYLGRKLAAALAAEGAQVHAWDRSRSDFDAIAALRPDAIYHLAAPPGGAGVEEVEAYLTLSLRLMAAAAAGHCGRFVCVGSWWQFGPDGSYRPHGLYGAAKQAVQDLLAHYAGQGLSACCCIPFDVYGPRDPRPRFLNSLAGAVTRPMDCSEGTQMVDFIHVDDVVAGLRAAAKAAEPAGEMGLYTLGTGRRVTPRQAAGLWSEATGLVPQLRWGALSRPNPPQPMAADRPPPGWRAVIALEDGLREAFRP